MRNKGTQLSYVGKQHFECIVGLKTKRIFIVLLKYITIIYFSYLVSKFVFQVVWVSKSATTHTLVLNK